MTSENTMIQRKRLTKLAKQLSDQGILYVKAPAGYGKTVFAEQWLDSRKEPIAMVTLDEYDNAGTDICYKLRNALEDLCAEAGCGSLAALTAHPDFSMAPVEFLMRAVSVVPRDSRGYLAIDDLHYLTDPSAQKILQDFFVRLPEGIRICILSREAPPESFSGLILKNELQFIAQECLLFDQGEICALYKSKNIAITKKQAEDILTYSEGWPIGINALLLSANQIPTEIMSQDWLESFLKTQVWAVWDENFKEFVLATCMEDVLSEGLCNALTGCSDSGIMLEQLVAKGAFLSRQRGKTYGFHRLFREFLRKQFAQQPEEYRVGQIRAAGTWYLAQKDFYHAADRFSQIKDYEQLVCCFDLLEEMERTEFDAEQVMYTVRNSLDEEMLDRYPHLYFMMAFTARNEGRLEEFKEYANLYYNNYPRIAERSPGLAHNIFFLYAMDFRITFKDILKIAVSAKVSGGFQGVRGSSTLYFPLYHKSYKDFSELLPGDIETEVELLFHILGPLLGEEGAMLKDCVLGGLYYETGILPQAQELALSAVAKSEDHFTPESKFCALALLLTVTHAMGQPRQEELIQRDIQKMIENDRAFYLQFNNDALICRNRLDSGDADAALDWLKTRGSDTYAHLDFLRLYGHFTTARAHIILGNFNHAIILLEKILTMCRTLNRPLDVMEAEVLLAIAFWKKKGSNRKKAMRHLEDAVKTGEALGCEQVFINEGPGLKNILSSLKNWTARSDYTGDISGTFVKKLYIGVAEQTKYGRVHRENEDPQTIKFTSQQKRVAKLMCEGYSYRKIAEELDIKFSTVRSHIELIYRKLDVSSMDEAIHKLKLLHILE